MNETTGVGSYKAFDHADTRQFHRGRALAIDKGGIIVENLPV